MASKWGDPLIQVLAVAFTALSLLVLLLSLLLLAMLAGALARRVLAPRARWYPYRVNLHAASLRVCALVLLLTQVGLWALRVGDPGASAGFPPWLLAPFLLLGLLSLQRQSSLVTFISAADGDRQFPYGPVHGFVVRVRIALTIAAWICVVPAVLGYNLPLDGVPNVALFFALVLLAVFPPLLLLNDDWIRQRLAGAVRR